MEVKPESPKNIGFYEVPAHVFAMNEKKRNRFFVLGNASSLMLPWIKGKQHFELDPVFFRKKQRRRYNKTEMPCVN